MPKKVNLLVGINHSVAFDRRAFTGVAHAANERGDVRLFERISEHSWADTVKSSSIDGIIVSRRYDAYTDELDRLGLPFIVMAEQEALRQNQFIVAVQEDAIGAVAAKHYLEAGYRHFAVCTRPALLRGFAKRIGGFVQQIEHAGCSCHIGPVAEDGPLEVFEDENLWVAEAAQWLASLPKPVGIFAPYDYHARVVVNVADQAGFRVPYDVAVIGVDDDDIYCMTTTPQLSSVVTAGHQVGQVALSTLMDILQHKAGVRRQTLLRPPMIMQRGSSSNFITHDPDVIAAVRFIRENVGGGITVEHVARHVSLSRRTLERRFSRSTSRSVRDELAAAKVARAKRLLIDTNLSLLEVARRSGFLWQQQLSRYIRQATGQTPLQFRASARQYRSD